MRMLVTGGLAVAATVGALVVIGPMRSEAKDYGQAAQTFPVIEPDLLSTIENRLKRAEASGELARFRRFSIVESRSGSITGKVCAAWP